METTTDGDLIARVGEGDAGAFEQLYQRYSRPVFALALRRLGDRGRAEDAVQETFASIWRSAESYRPRARPRRAWLYAVARNAIVDRRRAARPGPGRARRRAVRDAGPDERAESSWTAWRIHRALAELPEQERKLIELAYWGGLSAERDRRFRRNSRWERSRRGRGAPSRGSQMHWKESCRERPPDFQDLVGDDLSPDERERLERVHDMLISAGPPPELPPELEEVPDGRGAVRG